MNPGTRKVTVRWNNVGMVGDETLELWLKQNAGAWALNTSIAVAATATQSHHFLGLDAGSVYQVQIRAGRSGAYSAAYASGNPADWPVASFLQFTAGLPVMVLAAEWERTSGVSEQVNLSWVNDDPSRAVAIWRKLDAGAFVLVHTTVAGDAAYAYVMDSVTEGEHTMEFYLIQTGDDAVDGPASNHAIQWGGPAKPANVVQVGGPSDYSYDLQWDAPDVGAITQITDDYLCNGVQVDRYTSGANDTTATVNDPNPGGGPATSTEVIHAHLQHQLTQFAVTDFSEIVAHNVDENIYTDDADFHSCP